MTIKTITAREYGAEVMKETKPVLVLLTAPQISDGCQIMGPVIEEIAAERADNIKTVRLDALQNKTIMGILGLPGVPALVLYRSGKPVFLHMGLALKSSLDEWLDTALKTDISQPPGLEKVKTDCEARLATLADVFQKAAEKMEAEKPPFEKIDAMFRSMIRLQGGF
jgi:thioredoxin 1